ncbi:hypothetical protein RCL1_003040 [Eukaryota sp. TZLM3-RCL]
MPSVPTLHIDVFYKRLNQVLSKYDSPPEDGTTPETPLDPGTEPSTPDPVDHVSPDPNEPIPTDPVIPEPVEPVEPQEPSDPDTPSDPETPSEPEPAPQEPEPIEPNVPQEPEQPVEPTGPADEEPTTPTGPEQPSQPSDPTTPSDPVDPVLPEDPSTPEDPFPDPHTTKPQPPSTSSFILETGLTWIFLRLPESENKYILAVSTDGGKSYTEHQGTSNVFNVTVSPASVHLVRVRSVNPVTNDSSAFSQQMTVRTPAPPPDSVTVSIDYSAKPPTVVISWACVASASSYFVTIHVDGSQVVELPTQDCQLVYTNTSEVSPGVQIMATVRSVTETNLVGPSSTPMMFAIDYDNILNPPVDPSKRWILYTGAVFVGVVIGGLFLGGFIKRAHRRKRLVSRQYIVSVPLTPLDSPEDVEGVGEVDEN